MEGSWSEVEVVTTTATETWPLLEGLPDVVIAGGSTYDAVVAACARKAKAGVILTWNVRDFERVAEGVEVASPVGAVGEAEGGRRYRRPSAVTPASSRGEAGPAELLRQVGEGLAGLLQLLGLDLLLDLHLHRDALVELGADDLLPGVGLRDRELLARVREADAPLGLEELALLALLLERVGGSAAGPRPAARVPRKPASADRSFRACRLGLTRAVRRRPRAGALGSGRSWSV